MLGVLQNRIPVTENVSSFSYQLKKTTCKLGQHLFSTYYMHAAGLRLLLWDPNQDNGLTVGQKI